MGNCCRRGSSTAVWDGDDWGSLAQGKSRCGSHDKDDITNMERQRLIGGKRIDFSSVDSGSSSSSPFGSGGEVKIKITKRELEALMASVDRQGLSLEQVLAGLINDTDDSTFETLERHGSWKPGLQTIPEVD